jgi:predicted Zn-dependent peptidase
LSYLDKQFPILEVMSTILGGGMSSRLFIEVRERRGLAYRVRAGISAYNETGDFVAMAGLNNGNLIPALNIILEQFKRLTTEPVSAKELLKAKDYIKGTAAIGLESSDAQASFYADQELLEHHIKTVEERFALIDAVTSDDIMKLSQKLIRPERANLALVGPFEQDDAAIKAVIERW